MRTSAFCFSINKLLVFTFYAFITLSSAFTLDHQGHEREYSYVEENGTGPSMWGEIKPEWKACGRGKLQSPIDLDDDKVLVNPNPRSLKTHYKPASAITENRGHDIAVSWKDDAGTIIITGTAYKLEHCHWHFPSEHTKNGERYDAELHMVHKASDGSIAVVGILYRYGAPDPFISKLFGQELLPIGDAEKDVGILNPYSIGLRRRFYYRYIGSLTTPPCTEGVIWTILKKHKRISRSQVQAFINAYHEKNSRPIQEVNNRDVWLYKQ